MPLINCKIHLALSWSKDWIMSTIADTAFKIKSTKLYVPVVTLSTKHNVNLIKQLNEVFKRSVYWKNSNNLARFPFDASFQGVHRLFVFAFDNSNNGANKVQRNSHTKCFLPRVNITNYNISIDGRNF